MRRKLIQIPYQAAEVYFARFERVVSGASWAGLFGDAFDIAFALGLGSISKKADHSIWGMCLM